MSFAVQSQNFVQNLFGASSPAPATASTAAATTANPYSNDNVQIAGTNPESAGFFKKMGNGIGEMFSDLSYSMGMGETYRLVEREFQQADNSRDGLLNHGEFTVATLNPFEFQAVDSNYDGRVDKKEYTRYRKDRLEAAFEQKDVNRDSHLNIAEIGSIGRVYLANRDPRLDSNMDGLVNKREYVRAQLTLGISIRDLIGF